MDFYYYFHLEMYFFLFVRFPSIACHNFYFFFVAVQSLLYTFMFAAIKSTAFDVFMDVVQYVDWHCNTITQTHTRNFTGNYASHVATSIVLMSIDWVGRDNKCHCNLLNKWSWEQECNTK